MDKKRYKVVVTPFAEAALEQYDDYLRLELFSNQAADARLELFEREAASLSFFPEKHPLMEREPWRSEGVRCRAVKGLNIYFWINGDRMKVYIIDVVSQRMDQDKRLLKALFAFYDENEKK